MLNESEIFIEGERKLGFYQIEIARKTDSGWSPTIPALYALVSNYRLILSPQSRKHHDPASIPGNYITQIETVDMGRKRGIVLDLKTGDRINMFVFGRDGNEHFLEDVRAMKSPKPKFHYDDRVARQDIERLVSFLNQLK